MAKTCLYIAVFLTVTAALIADYVASPELDRLALDNWRTLRGDACAPCGAPCKSSN